MSVREALQWCCAAAVKRGAGRWALLTSCHNPPAAHIRRICSHTPGSTSSDKPPSMQQLTALSPDFVWDRPGSSPAEQHYYLRDRPWHVVQQFWQQLVMGQVDLSQLGLAPAGHPPRPSTSYTTTTTSTPSSTDTISSSSTSGATVLPPWMPHPQPAGSTAAADGGLAPAAAPQLPKQHRKPDGDRVTWKLQVAYLGAGFRGWAWQPAPEQQHPPRTITTTSSSSSSTPAEGLGSHKQQGPSMAAPANAAEGTDDAAHDGTAPCRGSSSSTPTSCQPHQQQPKADGSSTTSTTTTTTTTSSSSTCTAHAANCLRVPNHSNDMTDSSNHSSSNNNGLSNDCTVTSTSSPSLALSVEAVLGGALAPLCGGRVPRLAVGGRTDKGVNAAAQLVSFFTWSQQLTPQQIAAAVNTAAPGLLQLLSATRVPRSYHATFSTNWRRYVYLLPLRGDTTTTTACSCSCSCGGGGGEGEGQQHQQHQQQQQQLPAVAAVVGCGGGGSGEQIPAEAVAAGNCQPEAAAPPTPPVPPQLPAPLTPTPPAPQAAAKATATATAAGPQAAAAGAAAGGGPCGAPQQPPGEPFCLSTLQHLLQQLEGREVDYYAFARDTLPGKSTRCTLYTARATLAHLPPPTATTGQPPGPSSSNTSSTSPICAGTSTTPTDQCTSSTSSTQAGGSSCSPAVAQQLPAAGGGPQPPSTTSAQLHSPPAADSNRGATCRRCCCGGGGGAPVLVVELAGNRFLRRMVRVLVSTALREATPGTQAVLSHHHHRALLHLAEQRDRRATAIPAPADGLCFAAAG